MASDHPTRRVVLITGASSGIGAACASECSRAGFAVVLVARRADRLQALAASLDAAGGAAMAHAADVTDASAVDGAVAAAVDRFGRLDVAICNAGVGYYARLEDTPADVLSRLMDVNVMGSFHTARASLRVFRRQGHGQLIFVSSVVGRRSVPGSGAYAATKFAQTGLAEAFRTELLGSGIQVSTIFPISTETEFRDAAARTFGHAAGGLGPRQSADHVAREILSLIRRPRAERYALWSARLLALVAVAAPAWCDRVVQRFERRRQPPLADRGDIT